MRVIAIDGPAGSGKSTVARRLAEKLGLEYLDTGAMYRAVTFAALRRGIDPSDVDDVAKLVPDLQITVADQIVEVDSVDAAIEIRGPEVTRAVSAVAANPAVRTELRRRQQEWAADHGGGVIEGRDIGSVVFPDAELKVYLNANPEVRASRRAGEVRDLDYEAVAADIARRDALDQGREHSPLTQAEGAIEVDTTDRSIEQIVDHILGLLGVTEARGGASRGEWLLYRFVRGALLAFAKLWFRLSVEGKEHLPEGRPFIVSPIHRSNIDFLLVLVCCPRDARLRYLAKDTLWKGAWGKLWTALGGIPVARGTADREALRSCVEVIQNGESLVMFPEGTRQHGPELSQMFDGSAFVQSRTGAPIVPVGIGGSETAMPKGAKFIKPRKITVVIGAPLEPPVIGDDGARARRHALRDQTTKLGEEIQLLFDEAQRQAGTPNRREVHS